MEFEKPIESYIQTHSPKLYILTPCYGGQCFVNYVHSLMQTVELFRQLNFPLQIEFCKNDSLVSRARNNLIAKALSDPEMTHFMFIDADITWNPMDILKLVLSEKELVGGVYPLKHYFWEKIIEDGSTENQSSSKLQQILNRKSKNDFLNTSYSNEQMIQYNLLKYNINYLSANLTIHNNLAQVKHLATGFMLGRRELLEKMIAALPQTQYEDDIGFLVGKEREFSYALFDCGVEEGHYLSEDWLFCHRWSQIGGSIWVDVSINLTHTGMEDFHGSYIASVL